MLERKTQSLMKSINELENNFGGRPNKLVIYKYQKLKLIFFVFLFILSFFIKILNLFILFRRADDYTSIMVGFCFLFILPISLNK